MPPSANKTRRKRFSRSWVINSDRTKPIRSTNSVIRRYERRCIRKRNASGGRCFAVCSWQLRLDVQEEDFDAERSVTKNVHPNCHRLDLCPLGRTTHPGRAPVRTGSALTGLSFWTRAAGIYLRRGVLPSAESTT